MHWYFTCNFKKKACLISQDKRCKHMWQEWGVRAMLKSFRKSHKKRWILKTVHLHREVLKFCRGSAWLVVAKASLSRSTPIRLTAVRSRSIIGIGLVSFISKRSHCQSREDNRLVQRLTRPSLDLQSPWRVKLVRKCEKRKRNAETSTACGYVFDGVFEVDTINREIFPPKLMQAGKRENAQNNWKPTLSMTLQGAHKRTLRAKVWSWRRRESTSAVHVWCSAGLVEISNWRTELRVLQIRSLVASYLTKCGKGEENKSLTTS